MAVKKAVDNHPFKFKNICITGTLQYMTRNDAVSEIQKAGGYFDKSVSSSTDYLVIADKAGDTKLNRAKQLKTKTITEKQFVELLGRVERPTLELAPGFKPKPVDVDKMALESRDW